MLTSTVWISMSPFCLVFIKILKGHNFLIWCPFEAIHTSLESSRQALCNEVLFKSIWDDHFFSILGSSWISWILLDLFECSRSSRIITLDHHFQSWLHTSWSLLEIFVEDFRLLTMVFYVFLPSYDGQIEVVNCTCIHALYIYHQQNN
jgi:hypothetical protein